MNGRKRILLVIELLIVADVATAFMSGCYDGFCFVSSPPMTNTLSSDLAQQWCRNNGTRLIEITNKDIQNAMSGFLNSISSTYYYRNNLFTNGKRNSGSWTWVTRNVASGLSVGGANDASYAYAYLQLTSSAFTVTASRPVDTKQGYICENESQCKDTAGILLNNRCYKSYSIEALSWYDARNRCLDRGGDLASFEYIVSNQQGLNVLNGSWLTPSTAYWIDLRREWWTWRDSQTDIKYSNWLSGYPVTYPNDPNDCLCLQANGWSWTVCRCQESKPFICLSDVRLSTTTSTTTSTSTTTPTTTTTTTTSTTTTITTTTTTTTPAPITLSKPNSATLPTASSSLSDGSTQHDVTSHSSSSSKNTSESTVSIVTAFLGSTMAASSGSSAVLDVRAIAIGVGVGVGGGLLVLVLVIVVAVIVIRKRSKGSNPEKREKPKKVKKEKKKFQTPDIIALQTTNNREDTLYGTVIPQTTDNGETNTSYENAPIDKPQTIYENLQFVTKSSSDDTSPGVATDTGSSRPSSPSRLGETDVEVEHIEYNGAVYAIPTCATFL